MKKCSKCGKTKAANEFYKRSASENGLCSQCKDCTKIYRQSPKCKAVQVKYRQLPESKVARTRYQQSLEGKTTKKKYQRSPKGKVSNVKCGEKWRQTLNGYLHGCFNHINRRCNDPNDKNWKWYGAKGIQVRFKSFDEFFCHVTIDLGFNTIEKIKGLEIHRINNGNYKKNGIEFLTPVDHRARHKTMRRKLIRRTDQ